MSDNIIVERVRKVLLVRLNRPRALNALNTALAKDLVAVPGEADRGPGVGAMVITGSERAFAAGADITEMAGKDFSTVFDDDLLAERDRLGPCALRPSPLSPAMSWAADASSR